jgi:hypothetical protein
MLSDGACHESQLDDWCAVQMLKSAVISFHADYGKAR